MRLPAILTAIASCLVLILLPESAQAIGLNKIPPQRLLLIFPVIVLVIIGILLVVTRRR